MRRLVLLAALIAAALPVSAATATGAPRATGRLLVLLHRPTGRVAVAAAAARQVARAAGAGAGARSVPQIGLVTVAPRPGESLAALAARLRADPRVRSVAREHRFALRATPDDPALTTTETSPGTPPDVPLEWWAAREGLPAAWDISHGTGAVVAVIDSGVDATHPEFAGRIAGTVDLDPSDGPATSDQDGHGTHVASLACAAAGNGIGIAGAGYGCSLLVIKSDLTDSSVAEAIVTAVDRGADAINMSFGQDGRTAAEAPAAEKRAIAYAYVHHVTMVGAAADTPVQEQGDPANLLQPSGTGATLGSGIGLSVTAADYSDRRAGFAGYGSQISLAAYGAFRYGATPPNGPPGLLGAFPGNTTDIETGFPPCACRTSVNGDDRYAYLQGTSMAAPMVTAVAAVAHHLNPALHAGDVIRILEQTATRPAGSGWSPQLGWGILNGGAALALARATDRTRPVSLLVAPRHVRRDHAFALHWAGHDPKLPGVSRSGIARYEVWRSVGGHAARRIAVTRSRRLRVRLYGRPRSLYSFFTIAVDHAGNRESRPAQPDARTRIVTG